MRTYKTNIDLLRGKDNDGNQTVVIPFDVENKSIITDAIRAAEGSTQVGKASPRAVGGDFIPVAQGHFGIGMLFNVLLYCAKGYYAHDKYIMRQRYINFV